MKINEIDNLKFVSDTVIMIKIIETKGSVPRNKNVYMVISNNKQFGTIGGGELEFRATNEAKKLLKNNLKKNILKYPLGPSLGQCCGGYLKIELNKFSSGKKLIEKLDLKNYILKENNNLYIFGAGHVSKSIINKLDGVGFNIFVIDSREEFLSQINNEYIEKIFAKNPEIIIKNTLPNSFYLVMTHSHQLDLLICSHLLNINNFTFLGLIGSKTKRERFKKRLNELGYDNNLIQKIECPIGINSINGKEPDVIAISIIGRLLEFKSLINKSIENKHLKLIKG